MAVPSLAQDKDKNVEERIGSIEEYLETLPETLSTFTEELQAGIQQYTSGLEKSLEAYTESLQLDLESRLKGINKRRVLLNPSSQSFQTIETNSGSFLISIEKMEPIEGGYRLFFNIGNPHYANFRDFKLKLTWGTQWNEASNTDFRQWQESLLAAEYNFEGLLERGKWNAAQVDLSPATKSGIGYLVCEMEVDSVDLQF